jgi:hypothetical protein
MRVEGNCGDLGLICGELGSRATIPAGTVHARVLFNDDGIVAFTDFATLLCLGFPLPLRLSLKSRRRGWVEVYFFTSSYNAKQA